MKWLEVKAAGEPALAEAAGAILIGCGCPGVVEGEDKGLGGAGYGGKRAVITGYVKSEDKQACEAAIETISERLRAMGWSIEVSKHTDVDWIKQWKKGIRPVSVGRFFVRPTWSRASSRPGQRVIVIDPGLAFGTGSHPTTKLCLKAIALLAGKGRIKDKRVLDVGTGSGILAIAAKKLGAARVVATDNDPIALKVARKNARLNNARVTLSKKEPGHIRGRFTVVVSNILSTTLARLAPEISKRIDNGGSLVVSGILDEETDELAARYRELGLRQKKILRDKQWAAIIMEKP